MRKNVLEPAILDECGVGIIHGPLETSLPFHLLRLIVELEAVLGGTKVEPRAVANLERGQHDLSPARGMVCRWR